MKRTAFIFPVILMLLFTGINCDKKGGDQLPEETQQFLDFWEEFKEAGVNRNKDKMAEMTKFPFDYMQYELGENEFRELEEMYDTFAYFAPKAEPFNRVVLQDKTVLEMDEDEETGEYYLSLRNDRMELSSRTIFVFNEIDGKFKFTGYHIFN